MPLEEEESESEGEADDDGGSGLGLLARSCAVKRRPVLAKAVGCCCCCCCCLDRAVGVWFTWDAGGVRSPPSRLLLEAGLAREGVEFVFRPWAGAGVDRALPRSRAFRQLPHAAAKGPTA